MSKIPMAGDLAPAGDGLAQGVSEEQDFKIPQVFCI